MKCKYNEKSGLLRLGVHKNVSVVSVHYLLSVPNSMFTGEETRLNDGVIGVLFFRLQD